MTAPRISIIVPVRTCDNYLERTICSVLDQPWDDVELIVANGSGHAFEAVAQCYADELIWLSNKADPTCAEVINGALAQVTGEVVGILPAGDLYLPETLMHVGRRFAESEPPQWLVGNCLRLDSSDNELGRIEAALPRSLCSFLMHDSGMLPTPGMFYESRMLEAYGPFDAKLRFAFDYEMSARLLAGGETPVVASRLLAARREPLSMPEIDDILCRGREYIEAALRYSDQLAFTDRYALWRNCEQRRRIYALAEAEVRGNAPRRLLWQRLLHHPWWLADPSYRHALLYGAHRSTAPLPAA